MTRVRLRLAMLALVLGCTVPGLIGPARAAPLPHLDLDVTLDPTMRRIEAVATFTAPHAPRIALDRSLRIHEATADGKPLDCRRIATEGDVALWDVPAAPGARLRVAYGGVLPALDATLGERGVLTLARPVAAAAGSFLSAGSHWYPAPAALFSYTVRLSLPPGQRGVVPGHLVRESLPERNAEPYRATFAFPHPAEGIDLMAGPYTVTEVLVPRAGRAPFHLRTYFTPDVQDLAAGYLEASRRYIALYSKWIGAYPYRDFSVVSSPLPAGFGMPTLTYLGTAVLKLPFIRATSLGHEVLHNWWGNGVYPDYRTGNWSEGLTTFMADYHYKEEQSADAARAMRLGWLRDYAAVPAGAPRTLAEFRSRTHGAEAAIGYGKAAMLFFMLRDVIGEKAFTRGVRRLWREQRFKTASWNDLRSAFEEASGRPLRAFFEQWVEREGAPRLNLTHAEAHRTSRHWQLTLQLAQTAPPYALRVPVAVATTRGTMVHWIAIDREQARATFTVRSKPQSVRLDPDFRLWRVLDPAELPPILRLWILAKAPRIAFASAEPALQREALALAQRFFESAARTVPLAAFGAASEPLLIVGLDADVDAALGRLHLPPRPGVLAGPATARVWTIEAPPGRPLPAPVAVIAVHDADALAALLRPLPHYGAQSYLAFDGSRAIERGIWPASAPAVPVAIR